MECVPGPAMEGLKLLPTTPAPEYTPPEGTPWFNGIIGASSQTFVKGCRVATLGVTVIL